MSDTIRNKCASCGMPEQLPELPCGFCGELVPMPAGVLHASGTLSGAIKTEEIIGWKGMDVVNGLLRSPMYKHDGCWTPGQWAIAHCYKGNRKAASEHYPEAVLDDGSPDWANIPPVNNCSGIAHGCGYYAGRTREHLMGMGYQRYTAEAPTVLLEVQLAGKVIPASNGWRAQKIRPHRIYVPHELWQVGAELKANYEPHGVEIRMETTLILPKTDTPEWCPKCTARWEGRGLSCGFCGYTING